MNKNIKKIILILLFSFFLVPLSASHAVTFTPQITIPGSKFVAKQGTPVQQSTITIANYLKGVYNYLLAVVGLLAAVVLMGAGILWLTAAGNTEKVSQAKNLMTGSITGLILALTSYIILSTINPGLVDFKIASIDGVGKIDKVSCCGGSLGIVTFEYVETKDYGKLSTRDYTFKNNGLEYTLKAAKRDADGNFIADGSEIKCNKFGMEDIDESTQWCLGYNNKYKIVTVDKKIVCDKADEAYCLPKNGCVAALLDCRPDGWSAHIGGNTAKICPDDYLCYYMAKDAGSKGERCGEKEIGTCQYIENPTLGVLAWDPDINPRGPCKSGYHWASGGKDCGGNLYCCAPATNIQKTDNDCVGKPLATDLGNNWWCYNNKAYYSSGDQNDPCGIYPTSKCLNYEPTGYGRDDSWFNQSGRNCAGGLQCYGRKPTQEGDPCGNTTLSRCRPSNWDIMNANPCGGYTDTKYHNKSGGFDCPTGLYCCSP